jgi:hypothetical protein
VEGVGLALVGRGGQKQKVGAGLGQAPTQLVPRNLLGTAADAAGLVHDNQIPAGGDKVLEPFLVELIDVRLRPPLAGFKRLHGVERANHLVERAPDVFAGGNAAVGGEVGRGEETELLAKVGLHLRHPLGDKALGGDHQGAPDKPAQLQFAHDEAGFDGLAQADLVGQEEADAVLGDSTPERFQLVRQGNDRGAGRRQQHVLAQQVGDTGRVEDIADTRRVASLGGIERFEPVRRGAHDAIRGGKPDVIGGVIPKAGGFDHLAGLPVFDAP